MGFTYRKYKGKGERTELERWSNITVERDQKSYIKRKKSLLRQRFPYPNANQALSTASGETGTKTDLGTGSAVDSGRYTSIATATVTSTTSIVTTTRSERVEISPGSWLTPHKTRNKSHLQRAVNRTSEQLKRLAHKIDNEITKLKLERNYLKGKSPHKRLTRNAAIQHSLRVSEQPRKRRDQDKPQIEFTIEKYSSKHKFVCTSPRYAHDEETVCRPRMRTIGQQKDTYHTDRRREKKGKPKARAKLHASTMDPNANKGLPDKPAPKYSTSDYHGIDNNLVDSKVYSIHGVNGNCKCEKVCEHFNEIGEFNGVVCNKNTYLEKGRTPCSEYNYCRNEFHYDCAPNGSTPINHTAAGMSYGSCAQHNLAHTQKRCQANQCNCAETQTSIWSPALKASCYARRASDLNTEDFFVRNQSQSPHRRAHSTPKKPLYDDIAGTRTNNERHSRNKTRHLSTSYPQNNARDRLEDKPKMHHKRESIIDQFDRRRQRSHKKETETSSTDTGQYNKQRSMQILFSKKHSIPESLDNYSEETKRTMKKMTIKSYVPPSKQSTRENVQKEKTKKRRDKDVEKQKRSSLPSSHKNDLDKISYYESDEDEQSKQEQSVIDSTSYTIVPASESFLQKSDLRKEQSKQGYKNVAGKDERDPNGKSFDESNDENVSADYENEKDSRLSGFTRDYTADGSLNSSEKSHTETRNQSSTGEGKRSDKNDYGRKKHDKNGDTVRQKIDYFEGKALGRKDLGYTEPDDGDYRSSDVNTSTGFDEYALTSSAELKNKPDFIDRRDKTKYVSTDDRGFTEKSDHDFIAGVDNSFPDSEERNLNGKKVKGKSNKKEKGYADKDAQDFIVRDRSSTGGRDKRGFKADKVAADNDVSIGRNKKTSSPSKGRNELARDESFTDPDFIGGGDNSFSDGEERNLNGKKVKGKSNRKEKGYADKDDFIDRDRSSTGGRDKRGFKTDKVAADNDVSIGRKKKTSSPSKGRNELARDESFTDPDFIGGGDNSFSDSEERNLNGKKVKGKSNRKGKGYADKDEQDFIDRDRSSTGGRDKRGFKADKVAADNDVSIGRNKKTSFPSKGRNELARDESFTDPDFIGGGDNSFSDSEERNLNGKKVKGKSNRKEKGYADKDEQDFIDRDRSSTGGRDKRGFKADKVAADNDVSIGRNKKTSSPSKGRDELARDENFTDVNIRGPTRDKKRNSVRKQQDFIESKDDDLINGDTDEKGRTENVRGVTDSEIKRYGKDYEQGLMDSGKIKEKKKKGYFTGTDARRGSDAPSVAGKSTINVGSQRKQNNVDRNEINGKTRDTKNADKKRRAVDAISDNYSKRPRDSSVRSSSYAGEKSHGNTAQQDLPDSVKVKEKADYKYDKDDKGSRGKNIRKDNGDPCRCPCYFQGKEKKYSDRHEEYSSSSGKVSDKMYYSGKASDKSENKYAEKADKRSIDGDKAKHRRDSHQINLDKRLKNKQGVPDSEKSLTNYESNRYAGKADEHSTESAEIGGHTSTPQDTDIERNKGKINPKYKKNGRKDFDIGIKEGSSSESYAAETLNDLKGKENGYDETGKDNATSDSFEYDQNYNNINKNDLDRREKDILKYGETSSIDGKFSGEADYSGKGTDSSENKYAENIPSDRIDLETISVYGAESGHDSTGGDKTEHYKNSIQSRGSSESGNIEKRYGSKNEERPSKISGHISSSQSDINIRKSDNTGTDQRKSISSGTPRKGSVSSGRRENEKRGSIDVKQRRGSSASSTGAFNGSKRKEKSYVATNEHNVKSNDFSDEHSLEHRIAVKNSKDFNSSAKPKNYINNARGHNELGKVEESRGSKDGKKGDPFSSNLSDINKRKIDNTGNEERKSTRSGTPRKNSDSSGRRENEKRGSIDVKQRRGSSASYTGAFNGSKRKEKSYVATNEHNVKSNDFSDEHSLEHGIAVKNSKEFNSGAKPKNYINNARGHNELGNVEESHGGKNGDHPGKTGDPFNSNLSDINKGKTDNTGNKDRKSTRSGFPRKGSDSSSKRENEKRGSIDVKQRRGSSASSTGAFNGSKRKEKSYVATNEPNITPNDFSEDRSRGHENGVKNSKDFSSSAKPKDYINNALGYNESGNVEEIHSGKDNDHPRKTGDSFSSNLSNINMGKTDYTGNEDRKSTSIGSPRKGSDSSDRRGYEKRDSVEVKEGRGSSASFAGASNGSKRKEKGYDATNEQNVSASAFSDEQRKGHVYCVENSQDCICIAKPKDYINNVRGLNESRNVEEVHVGKDSDGPSEIVGKSDINTMTTDNTSNEDRKFTSSGTPLKGRDSLDDGGNEKRASTDAKERRTSLASSVGTFNDSKEKEKRYDTTNVSNVTPNEFSDEQRLGHVDGVKNSQGSDRLDSGGDEKRASTDAKERRGNSTSSVGTFNGSKEKEKRYDTTNQSNVTPNDFRDEQIRGDKNVVKNSQDLISSAKPKDYINNASGHKELGNVEEEHFGREGDHPTEISGKSDINTLKTDNTGNDDQKFTSSGTPKKGSDSSGRREGEMRDSVVAKEHRGSLASSAGDFNASKRKEKSYDAINEHVTEDNNFTDEKNRGKVYKAGDTQGYNEFGSEEKGYGAMVDKHSAEIPIISSSQRDVHAELNEFTGRNEQDFANIVSPKNGSRSVDNNDSAMKDLKGGRKTDDKNYSDGDRINLEKGGNAHEGEQSFTTSGLGEGENDEKILDRGKDYSDKSSNVLDRKHADKSEQDLVRNDVEKTGNGYNDIERNEERSLARAQRSSRSDNNGTTWTKGPFDFGKDEEYHDLSEVPQHIKGQDKEKIYGTESSNGIEEGSPKSQRRFSANKDETNTLYRIGARKQSSELYRNATASLVDAAEVDVLPAYPSFELPKFYTRPRDENSDTVRFSSFSDGIRRTNYGRQVTGYASAADSYMTAPETCTRPRPLRPIEQQPLRANKPLCDHCTCCATRQRLDVCPSASAPQSPHCDQETIIQCMPTVINKPVDSFRNMQYVPRPRSQMAINSSQIANSNTISQIIDMQSGYGRRTDYQRPREEAGFNYIEKSVFKNTKIHYNPLKADKNDDYQSEVHSMAPKPFLVPWKGNGTENYLPGKQIDACTMSPKTGNIHQADQQNPLAAYTPPMVPWQDETTQLCEQRIQYRRVQRFNEIMSPRLEVSEDEEEVRMQGMPESQYIPHLNLTMTPHREVSAGREEVRKQGTPETQYVPRFNMTTPPRREVTAGREEVRKQGTPESHYVPLSRRAYEQQSSTQNATNMSNQQNKNDYRKANYEESQSVNGIELPKFTGCPCMWQKYMKLISLSYPHLGDYNQV